MFEVEIRASVCVCVRVRSHRLEQVMALVSSCQAVCVI